MSEVASEPEVPDPKGYEHQLDHVRMLSQETTSYYGWLNILCYNVGYHNEHHDFPSVPWTRLPQLRAIAKEFYDPLPAHSSWPAVTYKFIMDPKVGMWSRAKRTMGEKGKRIEESEWTVCQEAFGPNRPQDDKSITQSKKEVGVQGEGLVRIVKPGEEDEMDRMMSEAVARGYGSDAE